MFFYIVPLTFVLHVALSMHVAVQHAESFENGIEKDRAIDPKGYRLKKSHSYHIKLIKNMTYQNPSQQLLIMIIL